jgi:hypothetical protein
MVYKHISIGNILKVRQDERMKYDGTVYIMNIPYGRLDFYEGNLMPILITCSTSTYRDILKRTHTFNKQCITCNASSADENGGLYTASPHLWKKLLALSLRRSTVIYLGVTTNQWSFNCRKSIGGKMPWKVSKEWWVESWLINRKIWYSSELFFTTFIVTWRPCESCAKRTRPWKQVWAHHGTTT